MKQSQIERPQTAVVVNKKTFDFDGDNENQLKEFEDIFKSMANRITEQTITELTGKDQTQF